MNKPHIPISSLVPAYLSIGYTQQAAVRAIVQSRLGCKNARGNGTKAGKRATLLAEHTAMEIKALEQRMRRRSEEESRAWWAAYRAEWKGEARSVSHHYAMCVHE